MSKKQCSYKKLKTQPNLNAEFYIDIFSLGFPAENDRSNILYHINDFVFVGELVYAGKKGSSNIAHNKCLDTNQFL